MQHFIPLIFQTESWLNNLLGFFPPHHSMVPPFVSRTTSSQSCDHFLRCSLIIYIKTLNELLWKYNLWDKLMGIWEWRCWSWAYGILQECTKDERNLHLDCLKLVFVSEYVYRLNVPSPKVWIRNVLMSKALNFLYKGGSVSNVFSNVPRCE